MGTKLYTVMLPIPGGGYIGSPTYLNEEQRDFYRECGYQVDLVLNVIPEWVVDAGLLTPWCIAQDIINFNFRWREWFPKA